VLKKAGWFLVNENSTLDAFFPNPGALTVTDDPVPILCPFVTTIASPLRMVKTEK
jgi:hypothetical protein